LTRRRARVVGEESTGSGIRVAAVTGRSSDDTGQRVVELHTTSSANVDGHTVGAERVVGHALGGVVVTTDIAIGMLVLVLLVAGSVVNRGPTGTTTSLARVTSTWRDTLERLWLLQSSGQGVAAVASRSIVETTVLVTEGTTSLDTGVCRHRVRVVGVLGERRGAAGLGETTDVRGTAFGREIGW